MTQTPLTLAIAMDHTLEQEGFQRIEDPEVFKTQYKNQIEFEENNFTNPTESLISYGIFNIEEVRPPYISGNTLIFYAIKKIPYRVSCNLPLNTSSLDMKYEMLSYMN